MLFDSKKRTSLLGIEGEKAVSNWLQKQGFTILCCNYRTRGGEIDVIARKKDVISFVEVKVRTTDYFNSSQLITKEKQKKIISTAQIFCIRNNLTDIIIRFDVALLQPKIDNFDIVYIPNAFTNGEYA